MRVIAESVQWNEEDEELIMNTQDLVETFIQEQRQKGREQGLEQGLQQGRQNAAREAIVEVFTERFGALPADVAAIVARTQDANVLRGWLKLVARASQEEALATIRASAAP